MIPIDFDYAAPATLDEALRLLAGGAKPLAGGMSLIPMMKLRLAQPGQLVDLGRIGGLNTVTQDGNVIRIGAMATHYELESSALLRRACPLLAETAGHIGDVQVRNRGTIGGSLAHADPAADYPAALFALDANVRLVKSGGDRTIGIGDFLLDTFTTTAEAGEIVREIIVPVEQPGTGTAYVKMLQPASGFAIVGVAARVNKVSGLCRLGVTGLASKAFAVQDGNNLAAIDSVEANSDIHASAAYRRQMAKVYAKRAIAAATAKAQ
jgi:carbon-monoxide dehydrogenase medium subunit